MLRGAIPHAYSPKLFTLRESRRPTLWIAARWGGLECAWRGMLAIARCDERNIRAETPRSSGESSESAKTYQKGRKMALKCDQNATKKASKSAQMSQRLSKTDPLRKRVDFRCQKGRFGSHFGTPFWTHFRIKSIKKTLKNQYKKTCVFWCQNYTKRMPKSTPECIKNLIKNRRRNNVRKQAKTWHSEGRKMR